MLARLLHSVCVECVASRDRNTSSEPQERRKASMFASQNTLHRAALAALASSAVWATSSLAQVNTATTQPLANPNLPATAAQNVVAESLGLSFASRSGNSLTISGVADNSALSGIGLQAGDQIVSVNGQPAGSGMNLLNELSRLTGGSQNASITVMTPTGTQRVLNVPA